MSSVDPVKQSAKAGMVLYSKSVQAGGTETALTSFLHVVLVALKVVVRVVVLRVGVQRLAFAHGREHGLHCGRTWTVIRAGLGRE